MEAAGSWRRRASGGLCRGCARGRSGSVVTLDETAVDVLVVGDLHGHLHNFAEALKVAALATNPGRHLILQELVHDPRTAPDGEEGDLSHRLVDVVCALKCQFPDRVHYLPGNHELSELTGRSIAKKGVPLNSLFRLGLEHSYGAMAGAILLGLATEISAAFINPSYKLDIAFVIMILTLLVRPSGLIARPGTA